MQKPVTESAALPNDEVRPMIQELQVREVELELQYEEFRQAQLELAQSRDRLSQLYDLAPIGYLTLDRHGTIVQANLTAASMLGVERDALLGITKLSTFVAPESQDTLFQHCRDVFLHEGTQICEVELQPGHDGRLRVIRLESVASLLAGSSTTQCLTALLDMTRTNEAESALRDSEERLRLALDCGHMGSWHWDLQTDLAEWDRRESVLLGLDHQEEKSGEAFFQSVHPDDRQAVRSEVAKCLDHDGHYESEFRVPHPDGTVRWLSGRGEVIRDKAGKPIKMVGVNFDVTDRKLNELELRRTRDELSDFVENATIGLHWVAADGTIVWANREELEMLGYGENEYVGRHIADFHVDENVIHDILTRLTNNEELHDCEARLRCKDGTIKHVLINSNVYWEDGKFIHTRCFTRDVTKRKEAEVALRELNKQLEHRVEVRSSTIRLLHDVAAACHKSATLEDALAIVLRQFSQFYGMCFGHAFRPAHDNADELVPFLEFYEDIGGRFDAFRSATSGLRLCRGSGLPGQVFATGKPAFETDYLCRELPLPSDEIAAMGTKMAIAFPVLVAENEVAAVLEFFSDRVIEMDDETLEAVADIGTQLSHVIERQRLEKQIADITSREQQRIGEELHDTVLQQLTGGTMMAESLRQQLEVGSTPTVSAAANLVQVLKDAQSQIRLLHRGLMPVEVDAAGLITALECLAKRTGQMHNLDCRFECHEQVCVRDPATATQLFRIAQEAVHNSVKHAQPDSIVIELMVAGAIRLAVRDDGRGIPPRVQAGSGNGILIMRYRAGVIGGRFEINSQPNRGTTVICEIGLDSRSP